MNIGQEGRSYCYFWIVSDNNSHKEENECGAINMYTASSLTPNYVPLLTPEGITLVKI